MHNVAHFIRKSTQIKSTFILNQVLGHKLFKPFLINRFLRSGVFDGGFAEFDSVLPNLDLSDAAFFSELEYKFLKKISGSQVKIILDYINKNEIKVAHFHYGSDAGIYYPLLKALKIPKIVSFYGYDCSSFPNYYFGLGKIYLKNRVFKQADLFLAMSEDMKEDLKKLGCPENKILVHYHGINCNKFFHEHDYSEKKVISLLSLGSLVPKKGHLFILQAIKKVIDSGITNIKLTIAGGGQLEKTLKDFVAANGLDKYVVFTGPIVYGSQIMMDLYRNADAFIHPSITGKDDEKEGIPGTIVEAMSAGIPVISTYHAGIPYIINSGETGFLVKENDISALTATLKTLIKDRQTRERVGKAGQGFALSNLDIKIKMQGLEAIYSKAINKNSH